jgi:hypothetical protein
MSYTLWSKYVQGVLKAAEKANLKPETLLGAISFAGAEGNRTRLLHPSGY